MSEHTLGYWLNRRRVELGLEWAQVADGAGISRQSLLAIRSGKSTPKEATAGALERVMGWQAGGIRAIGQGGEPVLAVEAAPDASAQGDELAQVTQALIAITGDPESAYRLVAEALRIRRERDSQGGTGGSGEGATG